MGQAIRALESDADLMRAFKCVGQGYSITRQLSTYTAQLVDLGLVTRVGSGLELTELGIRVLGALT